MGYNFKALQWAPQQTLSTLSSHLGSIKTAKH